MGKKSVTVKLEEEIWEKLRELAKRECRSLNGQVAVMLQRQLEKERLEGR